MFHENLRLKRKERGLSQEEVASRLHVVRQTISKWEKGMSVPDSEQLIKIAVILETTVSELLGAQACHQKPSDAACAENHRCCSARVCSFDFCNYGVELCANVATEITHFQKE